MTTKTGIANRTVSKLGQPRLSNIETQGSLKPARVINEMFDNVRDAVLSSHPWKFALKRVSLAKDAANPVWGFNYRYLKPNDYLGMFEVKDNPKYSVVGNYIETDIDTILYIRYIRRITEYSLMPAVFIEAFAARMAYEGCEEITQSNTKKEAMLQDYNLAIKEAYRLDAIENPPEELPESSWLLARY